jgi:hypothetical protein
MRGVCPLLQHSTVSQGGPRAHAARNPHRVVFISVGQCYNKGMNTYYHELPLDEGFDVLHKAREDRLVRGRLVSACSGTALFKSLQGQPIVCWECGCTADRWVADGESGGRQPVLNLFAMRHGRLVMMTRDHIIPRSLGGKDLVENLRPACSPCNGKRGSRLTAEEASFLAQNSHLICPIRQANGIKKSKKHQ